MNFKDVQNREWLWQKIVNGLSWKGDGEALTMAKGGFVTCLPVKLLRTGKTPPGRSLNPPYEAL
jgi:hypothetical protein